MKKYLKILILPLILLISLTGCGKSENKDTAQIENDLINKKEIFSKCLKEKDLSSYILKVNFEETLISKSNDKKEMNVSEGKVEMTKDPMTYHSKWKDDNGGNVTGTEEYVFDGKVKYYRKENGEWIKQDIGEKIESSQEESMNFVSTYEINPNSLLDSLEDYFTLTESGDVYTVELISNSENIDEIKNILSDNSKNNSIYGELTSLKVVMSFQKDNYYPVSFDLDSTFLNKDNDNETEIKQTGKYEEVNKLKNIEIPEELKKL